MKNIKPIIGIFGYGCVAKGFYNILQTNKELNNSVRKICVKNRNKDRGIDSAVLTYKKEDILSDDEINLVIELIDDAEAAYSIVKEALQKGKHVISANKKMIAFHLEELIELQNKFGGTFLYEASSCGSIPIIKTLEEHFKGNTINKLSGIFNGTSNYILTKLEQGDVTYTEALKQAQIAGFAESDPTNDVEGFDALYKLVILVGHAFGKIIHPKEIINFGISTVSDADVEFASGNDSVIKLIPSAHLNKEGKLNVFVLPQIVSDNSGLYSTRNEFNAVELDSEFSGTQFYQGRGAGSLPTGSAVYADFLSLLNGYKYSYSKYFNQEQAEVATSGTIQVYIRTNAHLFEQINFKRVYSSRTLNGEKFALTEIALDEIARIKSKLLDSNSFIAIVDLNAVKLSKSQFKSSALAALFYN